VYKKETDAIHCVKSNKISAKQFRVPVLSDRVVLYRKQAEPVKSFNI